MKPRSICLGLLLSSAAAAGLAQHEEHRHAPTPTPAPADHAAIDSSGAGEASRILFQSDMSLMTGMTAIDPQAGPAMAGWHVHELGVARVSYNRQGGPSGGNQIESSNWNMIHVQTEAGPGRLSLMMMNSLEPATYARRGSRELFQTGESYRGEPLVDRQHPHDFFMNLSATYRAPLGSDAGAWIQLAPVGEPALGPTAFMHRASAGENPTAPLGHHWQDSTHITFNVITIGAGWRWVSLEGSVFHGAEPDEHRWGIEGGRIDSASARAKFSFGHGWSAHVSHGFLESPEALEPGPLHRTTAAVSYGAAGDRPLAVTLLWGRNQEFHGTTDSALLEAAYQMTRADQIYGRAEYVEKSLDLLATKRLDARETDGSKLARIRELTLGYFRELSSFTALTSGLGADVTIYGFPSRLKTAYGSFPVSIHVFARFRWGTGHAGGGHRHSSP